MTEQEYQRLQNKMRRLPNQLEAARRRVAALENEACRYGMTELLESRPC